jgi:hypothetical protein
MKSRMAILRSRRYRRGDAHSAPCAIAVRNAAFIGLVAKGFDFLGCRLSPQGLAVAKQTWDRFAERAARLQEHEPSARVPPGALGAYEA